MRLRGNMTGPHARMLIADDKHGIRAAMAHAIAQIGHCTQSEEDGFSHGFR